MVDIHCHILPEVDDGAKTWEVAEVMCRTAIADGITHIVATPHANDHYSYDRGAHAEKLARLQEAAGEGLEFSLGCDFHLSYDNLQAAYDDPTQFTIAGTDYLLVELSDFAISPHIATALSRLRTMGLVPILTHPERNLLLQRSPEMVLRMVSKGCVVQVTAGALLGQWGQAARRTAEWLLERDALHVIASDAHDVQHRPPVLSAARDLVARWCDLELAEILVERNPSAIVHGQALPYFPVPRPGAMHAGGH